jgi:hypothetical protein
MEPDAPIDGSPNWQKKEDRIRRIKKSRLKFSEIRGPRENMGIPERNSPAADLTKAEFSPSKELIGEIGPNL